MSKQPPIAKPAPTGKQRPLCLNCKKPLRPEYNVVLGDDGPVSADLRYDHHGRTDAADMRRVWTGEWHGYPYRGAGEKAPTHCTSTCAIQHAASLCRKLLTGDAIKLNPAGLEWFQQGRQEP